MTKLIQIINAKLVDGNQLLSNSPVQLGNSLHIPATPRVSPPQHPSEICRTASCLGFLDLQINGIYGFDSSKDSPNVESFNARSRDVRPKLIVTSTTSFLLTMTSQFSERYHQVSPSIMESNSVVRGSSGRPA